MSPKIEHLKDETAYYAKRGFSKIFNSGAGFVQHLVVASAFVCVPGYYSAELVYQHPSDVHTPDIGDRQVQELDRQFATMSDALQATWQARNARERLQQEWLASPPEGKEKINAEWQLADAKTVQLNDAAQSARYTFDDTLFKSKGISELDAIRLAEKYRQLDGNGFGYALANSRIRYQMAYLDECQEKFINSGASEVRSCMYRSDIDDQITGFFTRLSAATGLFMAFLLANSKGKQFEDQTRGIAYLRQRRRQEEKDRKRLNADAPKDQQLQITVTVRNPKP
jgi:hypothetical protein